MNYFDTTKLFPRDRTFDIYSIRHETHEWFYLGETSGPIKVYRTRLDYLYTKYRKNFEARRINNRFNQRFASETRLIEYGNT